ncbi:hypothetical protein E1265_10510 [Streptomyces sp. 8K308]|uniref:hypothetical protein n=1 Tax=Streptomyces sp. 8K308 TaxID=2530388 RepID=UPI0010442533|nr:hypothetical protein [Streptomyces sp. 8K308]TDC24191.1 hypothetical protein E1265_10510 [Streptomyces sp. 8K308]
MLAYAVIPGTQARVMATAATAPHPGRRGRRLRLPARRRQRRLARRAPDRRRTGAPLPPLAGALLALAGIAVALRSLRRDRRAARAATLTA